MSDSRRDFLRKAGCGALSMAALASNMHILGRVSAFAQKRIDEETKSDDTPTTEDFPDYKALVCVFLAGGIDSNNLVIPNHSDATISNYQSYANVRAASTLAIPQASLLPISVPRLSNLQYGFHPNLPFFQSIYNSGKMAVLCNVGNLVYPMTRATYQNNSVQRPYQLFSHSDQVAQQQTSVSHTQSPTGWGGRVADKLRPMDAGGLIPMITSIAGAQVFTAGATTSPMAIGTGALNTQLVLAGFNNTAESIARRNAMNSLRTIDLASNNLNKAASQIMDGAVQASTALSTNPTIATVFPATGIGNQLLQVARLISLRTALNIKRQIFFVQIGGWDTHQNQLTVHNNQLTQISQALEAFWTCVNTEFNIGNSVTTFTLSDFSRTFQPSGSGAIVGTDHAWGTHAFIFGGSVIGGNFYGSTRPDGTGNIYPTLQLGGLDDTDGGSNPRGRWIPTTAVDQYAATMARWFGVLDADLNTLFPNLSHFTTSNMGFMA